MYADTITLFNRAGDPVSGYAWVPTVIHRVNLNIDRAGIAAEYGTESRDKAYLGIHYLPKRADKYIEGKRYKPPKQWRADELGTITICPTADFFIAGEWMDGAAHDADYREWGGFYGYLNQQKDGVFVISSVAIHSVIPLIEIMGY